MFRYTKPKQNVFPFFFWPMWLRQSQSHSGLFLLRGKKNAINQIMWKTQCLYHTLPSAMSKQPIHHQCVSKYTHSWTNTEENKEMQGITRQPDSLPCGSACGTGTLQKGAPGMVVGTEGQESGGTCSTRVGSLCLPHWFRAGACQPQPSSCVVFLSFPHVSVCTWFSF